MRRTTSTWTAAILGAALSAPTVSAQQSPTAATATGSNQVVESDPSFGMAAARGARNLLRNGLDYIDYQEFDRALKYLREAEKRQNELNEPEKTKLKEGIERAQRGMREAIGSETPYALSERTPHRSEDRGGSAASSALSSSRGFVAAKPQAQPVRQSEGDDRGEPIQLAGGEALVPPPPRRDSSFPTEPASLPEIPAPPEAPQFGASPALADAPLELADVEMPTPPPLNRIAVEPLSAQAPELTAAPAPKSAPEPDAAEMTQADLLAPLPDFDRLEVPPPPLGPLSPREDEAVQLSNSAPEPVQEAPAPILLENPNDDDSGAAPAPAAEMGGFELPPLGGGSIQSEPAATETSRDSAPEPIATPEAPAPRVSDADLDLPALPADLGGSSPAPMVETPAEAPASQPEPRVDPAVEADIEIESEMKMEPETDSMAQPAPIADEPEELPELPGSLDEAPRMAVAPADEPVAPAVDDAMNLNDELPELPEEAPPTSAPTPTPTPAPAAELDVEELPAPAPAAAPAAAPSDGLSASLAPRRRGSGTTLSPELQRRVEEVAQRMEAEATQNQSAPEEGPTEFDATQGDDLDELRTDTQIDISRAPSPAEARPIAAIPVPEDWVPLGTREWSPQRKYWAAAATCHMPLYFQDPMLERYGHNVEKFIGPAGRFFSYPVDNHTQTTQRNQMAQPFASVGLFAFQILTLPYAMVMDPPWEAQYDLGYWRPGDKIPTDLYYLPTHGTGPALKGRKY